MQHINPLTSVRFFAALWVVLFHFRSIFYSYFPSLQGMDFFLSKGHHAVPFFFILSGFILSHSYFPKYKLADHGRFVWLRFARIWPLHITTVAIFVCYVAALKVFNVKVGGMDQFEFNALPSEILMVRSWFDRRFLWNAPAWSIQAEWFAYIFLFPLCYLAFKRPRATYWSVPMVLIMLWFHAVVARDTFPGVLFDIIIPFVAGSLIYNIRLKANQAHCVVSSDILSGLSLLLMTGGILLDGPVPRVVLLLGSALLVFSLSLFNGRASRLMSNRWLVYGGSISYSLYMTHTLVHYFYFTVIGKIPHGAYFLGFVICVSLIALTILTACLFYHFIELPANKRLRGMMDRRGKDNGSVNNLN